MSLTRHESQGTGLGDVLDILVKAPLERLLSLTFQLGESPEDNIIHALCLIILRREEQALNRLQMLRDYSLAKHVAEKWQTSGGNLKDFEVQCGHAVTGEFFVELARIFKVLSEQRLCDPNVRNLAYKRALSSETLKTVNSHDLVYDKFREEAKVVCGPEFAEWMCSFTGTSYQDACRSLEERKVSQDQRKDTRGLPSPLQASFSVPSYPSHLEISCPPTATRTTPKPLENPQLNRPIHLDRQHEAKDLPIQSRSSEPQNKSAGSFQPGTKEDSPSHQLDSHMTGTQSQPSTEATTANISFPMPSVSTERRESRSAAEENMFYAFVILHAPEDAEVAESMKEKVEKVIRREGATFCEDFAIPGKSTLSCVEDAINNSAFTFLLLTRNFNTRLLELKTNTALINSINMAHKYNTVIPLLPRENAMPRQRLSMVLKTIVPLEENKSFDKKIQKALTPAKIDKQKRIWSDEMRRQERLRRLESQNFNVLTQSLCYLNIAPEQEDSEGRSWWPQQPNIHINNARYIMIGNDSQMTVDYGGSANRDDSG
ncbi:TIR domain-containing adapter molecule 1 [Pholidichthys leucotaenia]